MTRAAELHREAMALADQAMVEAIKGNREAAAGLYKDAFGLEREAASEALAAKLGEPTISILHRSAATLALDAHEAREAERLVATALALNPPDDIADELRDLLEQVHFHRHLSLRGLELNPGEFQFAMTGPAVGFGIVSSREFVERVETVETLLYRTAERNLKRPFRERGRRKQSLQEEVAVYVSVPRAASFAVTFKIGSNPLLSLFPGGTFADELVEEVLTCFEMLNRGDDESIRRRIPDAAYFTNFVSLAKKIAPDGEDITGVGFTAIAAGVSREVELRRPRKDMPSPKPLGLRPVEHAPSAPVTVTGRLEFASKLNQQSEIRIEPDGGGPPQRVRVPEGMMNDIVKPLWDERVTIRGTRQGDEILLLTIDPAE